MDRGAWRATQSMESQKSWTEQLAFSLSTSLLILSIPLSFYLSTLPFSLHSNSSTIGKAVPKPGDFFKNLIHFCHSLA